MHRVSRLLDRHGQKSRTLLDYYADENQYAVQK